MPTSGRQRSPRCWQSASCRCVGSISETRARAVSGTSRSARCQVTPAEASAWARELSGVDALPSQRRQRVSPDEPAGTRHQHAALAHGAKSGQPASRAEIVRRPPGARATRSRRPGRPSARPTPPRPRTRGPSCRAPRWRPRASGSHGRSRWGQTGAAVPPVRSTPYHPRSVSRAARSSSGRGSRRVGAPHERASRAPRSGTERRRRSRAGLGELVAHRTLRSPAGLHVRRNSTEAP